MPRAGLALALALTAATAPRAARAGLLPAGAVVYTASPTGCPSAYAALSSTWDGYVFVGDTSAGESTPGTTNGAAAMSAGAEPTHNHGSGSLTASSLCASTASTGASTIPTGTALLSPGTVCNSAEPGTIAAATSGYPFVNLQACVATAATGAYVEANAVFFLQPPSTTPAQQLCPTPSSTFYTAGQGRAVVPLYPGSSSVGPTSPTPALTSASLATHAHSFNATLSFSGAAVDATDFLGWWVADGVPSSQPTLATSTYDFTAADAGIPIVLATLCESPTGLPSPSATPVFTGALVFFAATSCPTAYEDVPTTSPVVGRLVVPASGATGAAFGSANPLAASGTGTGPDPHDHSVSGVVMTGSSEQASLGGSASSGVITTTSFSLGAAPSTPAAVALPYVALRLCEKLAPASSAPSAHPSSSPSRGPTRSPTRVPTTGNPAYPPSSASPTQLPTLSPTPRPTPWPTPWPTLSGAPTRPPSSPAAAAGAPSAGTPTATTVPTSVGAAEDTVVPIAAGVGGGVLSTLALVGVWRYRRQKSELERSKNTTMMSDWAAGAGSSHQGSAGAPGVRVGVGHFTKSSEISLESSGPSFRTPNSNKYNVVDPGTRRFSAGSEPAPSPWPPHVRQQQHLAQMPPSPQFPQPGSWPPNAASSADAFMVVNPVLPALYGAPAGYGAPQVRPLPHVAPMPGVAPYYGGADQPWSAFAPPVPAPAAPESDAGGRRRTSRFDVTSLPLTGKVLNVDFDFNAQQDDEITVEAGDLVMVFEQIGEWLVARNTANQIGLIPANVCHGF